MPLLVTGLRVALALLLFAITHAHAQPVARFDILEYRIEGNTVLEAEAIERAVTPFLGPQRTIDDVEAARAALEKAYRDAGFATVGVDVPEQSVDAGIVVLRVVPGAVSRLRVTGARYFSQQRIVEQVDALAEGRVPNLKDAQTQLAAVNRTSDRRVTPLLRPGRTPGTTEVDLQVEDSAPLHGSLELNNRASDNTSATRLQAGLRYDNLFQRDHSLALQAQLSPQKTSEVRVISLGYTVPLGLDALSFSFVRSNSESSAGVGDVTVFGKGNIWGLRRSVLIALRDGEYHSASLGADYKDFAETTDAGTGEGFKTPVRYLPFSAGYTGLVDDVQGRWRLGANLMFALRGVASSESQFADKRFGATSGFAVLKLDGAREQKFGNGSLLTFAANLQFSQQPLISNEQFVAGGADSVRGYKESAAVGDFGLRASAEWRTPSLVDKGGALASLVALGFVDGAALEIKQPLPGQSLRTRLLGAGAGLRARAGTWGSLGLDLGWALKSVGNTERGDLRAHASVALEF